MYEADLLVHAVDEYGNHLFLLRDVKAWICAGRLNLGPARLSFFQAGLCVRVVITGQTESHTKYAARLVHDAVTGRFSVAAGADHRCTPKRRRRSPRGPICSDKPALALLFMLRHGRPVSGDELSEELKVSKRYARQLVSERLAAGHIEKAATAHAGQPAYYSLTASGQAKARHLQIADNITPVRTGTRPLARDKVLEVLRSSPASMTIKQICSRARVSKASAHRAVTELAGQGLIEMAAAVPDDRSYQPVRHFRVTVEAFAS